MPEKNSYHCVLTIAGSDSSGGAGIQADIKTLSALGCYAASVITALTAQNTCAVNSIYAVSEQFVGEQLDAVFSDITFSAVKIGMLHRPEIITVVSEKMTQWQPKNIVLDPVMISKSGCKLISDEAILELKNTLIPRVNLITPNLDEATALLSRHISSCDDMQQAARELGCLYKTNVLIKGGHARGELSSDVLFYHVENTFHWFDAPRVDTQNTHGTGCTFSSAIAACLAQGMELPNAIAAAKKYLSQALLAGSHYELGKGHGPVKHFLDEVNV